jgi:putative transposase
MRKTFKYRIYPTKKQTTLLNRMLEECRWVYNETLAYRKNAWETEQKSISLFDTQKLLTQWKKERASLSTVHSQVLQEAQTRVDLAFKAFFRRVKKGETPGYPRFRGRGRYDSLAYPQSGWKIEQELGQTRLSKIGTIKTIFHRPIEGKIKTCILRRKATGKWFICFSCEVSPKPLPHSEKAVGIDVGINSFATFSNGEKIDNPRFFRTEEKEIAKVQRKLSKIEKKCSKEYKNRKHILALVHERIVDKRSDFSHKLSRRIINQFGIICFENLNVKEMVQNHCLAKSIQDAAWNQFVTLTTYKAEEAGRSVVLVDPYNTSKRCSRCGVLVPKTLNDRVHSCSICGLKIDRDENAAINILALGLQRLGRKSLEVHDF